MAADPNVGIGVSRVRRASGHITACIGIGVSALDAVEQVESYHVGDILAGKQEGRVDAAGRSIRIDKPVLAQIASQSELEVAEGRAEGEQGVAAGPVKAVGTLPAEPRKEGAEAVEHHVFVDEVVKVAESVNFAAVAGVPDIAVEHPQLALEIPVPEPGVEYVEPCRIISMSILAGR